MVQYDRLNTQPERPKRQTTHPTNSVSELSSGGIQHVQRFWRTGMFIRRDLPSAVALFLGIPTVVSDKLSRAKLTFSVEQVGLQ